MLCSMFVLIKVKRNEIILKKDPERPEHQMFPTPGVAGER